MSTTQVTWTTPCNEATQQLVVAKAADMAAQGKTDNIPIETGGIPPDPLVVVRTWTTPEDAAEWISFLETYPGIISAVIT